VLRDSFVIVWWMFVFFVIHRWYYGGSFVVVSWLFVDSLAYVCCLFGGWLRVDWCFLVIVAWLFARCLVVVWLLHYN